MFERSRRPPGSIILAVLLVAVQAATGCGPSRDPASRPPASVEPWRWDSSLSDEVNLARADSLIEYGHHEGVAEELRARLGSRPLGTRADSLLRADLLDLLVSVLWQSGRWHDPETGDLAARALADRRRLHGADAVELDRSLFNLGVILTEQGRYDAAGPCFEELVRLRRRHLGPGPETARALNALGNWCWFSGDIQGARENYEEAIGILRASPDPPGLYLGMTLGNLASMLVALGEDDRALEYSRESIRVFEGMPESSTFHLADAYAIYAEHLRRTGSEEDLRPYIEKALDLYRAIDFEDHYSIIFAENLLATVCQEAGGLEEAREHYRRALTIAGESYGPRSHVMAAVLANLATLQIDSGEYEKALANCRTAVAVLDSALTTEHPLAIHGHAILAAAHLLGGNPAGAAAPAFVAEEAARRWSIGLVGVLSEREALQFESRRISGLDVLLSTLCVLPEETELVSESWDALVRARGLVLDEVASRRRYLETAADPELEPLLAAHLAATHRLARLVHAAAPGVDFRDRLEEELGIREELERDIASRSRAHRDLRERDLLRRNLGLGDVRDRLPPRAGLAAFVRYHRIRPHDLERPRVSELGHYRTMDSPGTPYLTYPGDPVDSYAAFVLPPSGGDPVFVPLGDAAPIDALVRDWRESVEDSTLEAALEVRSRRLREKVWDPLAAPLADAELVFLVPDGTLNLVAFDALSIGSGRFLLEEAPPLHYLSSERDLVRTPRPLGKGALFVGGPDFSGLIPFVPLPAAESEARELAGLLERGSRDGYQPVEVLTGAAATESRFVRLAPGRRIVHLATHAFTTPDLLGAGKRNLQPLQLSGLALAGANGGAAERSRQEDGILHAEEVASLRLSGAEWVVLSACESGVGSVQAREGVLGLRRAFESSDARTLIMSLWKVEDDATRRWMRHLYEARLNGASTPEAMRSASRAALAERRRAGSGGRPGEWGAFVAVGDWQ